MDQGKLKERLTEKGLKVTSRRLAILEAIIELHHPTADDIIRHIRKTNPETATATVYKALNVLAEKNVIDRVNTDKDIGRYDAMMESHHHLYSPELNRIEDYEDEELTMILKKYFRNRKINGFRVDDFKLQINGRFTG